MKINITEFEDGRFYAEYINPKDKLINRIGQYGNTAFEAEANLQALLNAVKKQMLKKELYTKISLITTS